MPKLRPETLKAREEASAASRERISKKMAAIGMSQTDLAERAHLDRPQFNRALGGKIPMSAAMAAAAERVLDDLREHGALPDGSPEQPAAWSSTLAEFIKSSELDLTMRERLFLEGCHFDQPVPNTRDFWAGILAAFRAGRR